MALVLAQTTHVAEAGESRVVCLINGFSRLAADFP